MQTQMMTRVRVLVLTAVWCGVTALAQGEARSTTLRAKTPARMLAL